ncbi:chemotaxis protein CheX [Planctomycetales bacterium ZRK34]|nr:chemotaxis protein CheX [Planctomycetales bacterium ZRK34]
MFDTLLQVQVDMTNPKLKSPGDPVHDVSAIIGMSGEATGAVVLSFPQETALRLVSLMVGEEIDADHPDFADAVGEMANMVAGGAKAKFVDCRVSISCPSVVIGSGHRVFQTKNAPIVEIPCDCECGSFSVMITMQPSEVPAQA